jgi:hypothetical protein
MRVENLLRVAWNDLKLRLQLPQQFRAPGRRGCKDERRQFHAPNLTTAGESVERRSTLEFKLQLVLGALASRRPIVLVPAALAGVTPALPEMAVNNLRRASRMELR